MKVKIVTGYVPIPAHPRTAEEYGKLGENFRLVKTPIRPFYYRPEQCWLHGRVPPGTTYSKGDNPEKNSLLYHIVNHQKTEWLYAASLEERDTDVFVWIDYGVFRLPGVTAEAIDEFCAKLDDKHIYIPGCWPYDPKKISDEHPCWRFCGTVLAVPRKHARALDRAVKDNVKAHIMLSDQISWEVNTWARIEQHKTLPIKWYAADHNSTLFTGFSND